MTSKMCWSLGTFLATAVFLGAFFGISIKCYQDSKVVDSARQELLSTCNELGGSGYFDLVDGDLFIDLSKSAISKKDGQLLHRLIHDATNTISGNTSVHLSLSDASLEFPVANIVSENIVALDLAGLPIDDVLLAEIVTRCPKIKHLNLDRTNITDSAIPYINNLPIQSLSVAETNVSANALLQLGTCSQLYELVATLSDQEIQTLTAALPGCEIRLH